MLITTYIKLKKEYDKNYMMHNKEYPLINYEADKNLITFINDRNEIDTIAVNKILITRYVTMEDLNNTLNNFISIINSNNNNKKKQLAENG